MMVLLIQEKLFHDIVLKKILASKSKIMIESGKHYNTGEQGYLTQNERKSNNFEKISGFIL